MRQNITTNLFCSTYGHNYFRLSRATENTPELICKCCKNYFKFEKDGNIVSVTYTANDTFSKLLYRKKTA